jgi:Ca2+-binding EF-hand superfamily protein
MEELDANGDGEIDFHEFMAMMSNQDLRDPTGTFVQVTARLC